MKFLPIKKIKISNRNSGRGFSLPELIIYIALIAAFTVVIVNTLLTMTKAWSAIKISKNIAISGETSMERITREAKNALSIDQVNSIFGVNPGTLILNSKDDNGNASVVKFFVSSSTLQVQKSGQTENMTNSEVTVSNLIFRRISTAEGEAVRVEMALQDTVRGMSQTKYFYTTVILRGEYSK